MLMRVAAKIKIILQKLAGGLGVNDVFSTFAADVVLIENGVGGDSGQALVAQDCLQTADFADALGESAAGQGPLAGTAVHIDGQADHNPTGAVFHGVGTHSPNQPLWIALTDDGAGKREGLSFIADGQPGAGQSQIHRHDDHTTSLRALRS